MAKASATITVSLERDISSVTRYYKLQASTASAPAKPTTLTPSGWTTTEPAYTEGSTNSLYITDRTVFTDGTYSYSDVSLSSSYEAAKAAYNKAVAAQQAAENTNQYFWVDEDGAHVSMIEGEADSGKNMLMNSTGIFLRDGENTLAKFDGSQVTFYDGNGGNDVNIVAMFGEDGAQVGYNNLGHIMLSSNEMRVVDDDGSDMFSVGPNGANDYVETTKTVETTKRVVTSEMSAYPHVYTYSLPLTNYTTGGYLKVNFYVYYNSNSGGMTYEHAIRQTKTFVIGTRQLITTGVQDVQIKLDYMSTEQPGTVNDKKLRVEVYKTTSSVRKFCLSSINYEGFTPMPAYNIGTRVINANNPGAYSTIIGEGLVATGDRQIAIGKFNIEDTNDEYALIVGNGTGDQNRSNALTVDWGGNVNSSGTIKQNGTAVALSGHIHAGLFAYEDVQVSVTYAAGTIGSRGASVALGTTVKTGYTYIGAVITDHRNTSVFSATVVHNGPNNTAHLAVYRATGNAASNLSVIVRKVWVLSDFATS